VASAIGTLKGPLHGGANEEVLAMLREIGSVADVRSFIEARVKAKQKIMGMGHRVYKVKDPRATILQKFAVKLFAKFGGSPLYEIGLEVEKVTKELLGSKGVYPNVDFYSGILYDKMGIAEDLFTPIFGIARVGGWVSHWIEQLKVNRIYRPSQIYAGLHGVEYTPIHVRE
jgi:citrate synthase